MDITTPKKPDVGVLIIKVAKLSMTCYCTVVSTIYDNSGGVGRHFYIFIVRYYYYRNLLPYLSVELWPLRYSSTRRPMETHKIANLRVNYIFTGVSTTFFNSGGIVKYCYIPRGRK